MISNLLNAFVANLNLISLIGLSLDAFGALLVLGPNVSTIAKWGSHIERSKMRDLFSELLEAKYLDESSAGFELFDDLLKESTIDATGIAWSVEALRVEDGIIRFGNSGFGSSITRPVGTVEGWIEEYRGKEQDFYRAGAGLLLLGFLLQIAARLGRMNTGLGFLALIITLVIALLMGYRVRQNVRYILLRR